MHHLQPAGGIAHQLVVSAGQAGGGGQLLPHLQQLLFTISSFPYSRVGRAETFVSKHSIRDAQLFLVFFPAASPSAAAAKRFWLELPNSGTLLRRNPSSFPFCLLAQNYGTLLWSQFLLNGVPVCTARANLPARMPRWRLARGRRWAVPGLSSGGI